MSIGFPDAFQILSVFEDNFSLGSHAGRRLLDTVVFIVVENLLEDLVRFRRDILNGAALDWNRTGRGPD